MGESFGSIKEGFFWCYFYLLCSFSLCCYSADRILSGQVLKDGDVLISHGGNFSLGFFSPGNSKSRYVGIWFHRIQEQTVVWVANKENPIQGPRGTLTLDVNGNLVILNGANETIWSTDASLRRRNSYAVLKDSGNLELRSTNHRWSRPDKLQWQSFDFPGDTRVHGWEPYYNDGSKLSPVMTSWKSDSDPSPGNYSIVIDPRGAPQFVVLEGQGRHWRSGYWDGTIFIGVPGMKVGNGFGFKQREGGGGKRHFEYETSNNSQLMDFRILPNGTEEQRGWNVSLRKWDLLQSHPSTECEVYNRCGPFGICNDNSNPICSCLTGYVPRDLNQWGLGNWSGGCIRRTKLQCEGNNEGRDWFLKVDNVKLPDFVDFIGSDQDNNEKCQELCLKNCSCIACTFVSGINCMIWHQNDLLDIQKFMDGEYNLNPLFIRLASSENSSTRNVLETGSTRMVTKAIKIALGVSGSMFTAVLILLLCRWKEKLQAMLRPSKKKKGRHPDSDDIIRNVQLSGPSSSGPTNHHHIEGSGMDFSYFSLSSVKAATDNFSDEKKLGHGGFGHVYKGVFPGSQVIAVKRLSGKSRQGIQEFQNEMTLIAKLQHINLVRLFGCCVEGGEKILLYEYMPNKSLDSFLFDSLKRQNLDWSTRFHIIEGIARGLLYLHRDSRLRIVHRDLKPSNILLDDEMNPKISDFGLARIFGGNQNDAGTKRVVGTYGYMSPEYAMGGLFSDKSDVYSFGVLLLEIISGRRNSEFRSDDHPNVVGHAWELWDKGNAMDLVDTSIARGSSSDGEMVCKCIHIAMLCVQDSASDRPTMASVVLMLESENANLPPPKQSTLTSKSRYVNEEIWNEIQDAAYSRNNITLSTIVGR